MSEPSQQPLPHDGWKSRTFIVTVSVLGVLIAIATAAMFVTRPDGQPIIQAAQWTSFMQWLVPSVLLVAFGKAGSDKWAEAKRNQ